MVRNNNNNNNNNNNLYYVYSENIYTNIIKCAKESCASRKLCLPPLPARVRHPGFERQDPCGKFASLRFHVEGKIRTAEIGKLTVN